MAASTVSGIERGARQRLHVENVDALATALGVSLGQLVEDLVAWRRQRERSAA